MVRVEEKRLVGGKRREQCRLVFYPTDGDRYGRGALVL